MSDDQTRYRVVRGPIAARLARPVEMSGGMRIGGQHYYAGQILPEIDPAQARHLLSLKMIEPLPDPAETTE